MKLVTIDCLPYILQDSLRDLFEKNFETIFLPVSSDDHLDNDDGDRWITLSSESRPDKYCEFQYGCEDSVTMELSYYLNFIHLLVEHKDKENVLLHEWTPCIKPTHPFIAELIQDLLHECLSSFIEQHLQVYLMGCPNYALECAMGQESNIHMTHIIGCHQRLQQYNSYTVTPYVNKAILHIKSYIEEDIEAKNTLLGVLCDGINHWCYHT
jgi:hypothetical protein